MVGRSQWTPLALHTLVRLHFYLALAPLEAVGLVAGDEVGKEQRVGSLGTVFGQKSHQQQVHAFGLVELYSTQ